MIDLLGYALQIRPSEFKVREEEVALTLGSICGSHGLWLCPSPPRTLRHLIMVSYEYGSIILRADA